MSLETNVLGNWEKFPADGGTWKGDWGKCWGPVGGFDWTSFEHVTQSQPIKNIRKFMIWVKVYDMELGQIMFSEVTEKMVPQQRPLFSVRKKKKKHLRKEPSRDKETENQISVNKETASQLTVGLLDPRFNSCCVCFFLERSLASCHKTPSPFIWATLSEFLLLTVLQSQLYNKRAQMPGQGGEKVRGYKGGGAIHGRGEGGFQVREVSAARKVSQIKNDSLSLRWKDQPSSSLQSWGEGWKGI